MKQIGIIKKAFVVAVFSQVVSSALSRADNQIPPTDAISGKAIRRHVEVLADDRMEGRQTGTEGYVRAANYVAKQFESALHQQG